VRHNFCLSSCPSSTAFFCKTSQCQQCSITIRSANFRNDAKFTDEKRLKTAGGKYPETPVAAGERTTLEAQYSDSPHDRGEQVSWRTTTHIVDASVAPRQGQLPATSGGNEIESVPNARRRYMLERNSVCSGQCHRFGGAARASWQRHKLLISSSFRVTTTLVTKFVF